MKYALVMLILCASCTFRKEAAKVEAEKPLQTPVPKIISTPDPVKNQEREMQKILHWFEQMDAILRESLWVIRQERAPQGKSIFGKMQRALLIEMKQKLSNKSLFKCDVYSMTRNVKGLGGVPQSAEVFHQCNRKESFVKIGDWDHPTANELTMNFRGGNLSEVLGFTTGILSPKIDCKLKSTENGIIEKFSCENLMFDYNAAKNQVLRFSRFEFEKNAKSILHIKAEVLESLEPVRKIEVDVPMDGAISVTETVIQPPEFLAKQVPAATPPPIVKPQVTPGAQQQENPDGQNQSQNQEQNQNPQGRGGRTSGPVQQQPTPHPEEGSQEFSEGVLPQDQIQQQQQQQEGGGYPPGVQPPQQQYYYPDQQQQQQQPQQPQQPQDQATPVPDIPREQNTR
ncbi:hypothetical protein [Bdellovibrio sp. HCB337]|uniref:hypothetical protein n=1 Tax=Bdellovibrio sp. HCB337 TaxID=3394358 RepID=UPI0039A5E4F3